jgi:MFS family permease
MTREPEARGPEPAPASHSASASPPPGLPPAFRHRNYRIYFLGMSASLAGYWMQTIAMSWLIYRITGSVFMLGVVAFASQIPMLVCAPFGGLLADRLDRRRLLVITQSLLLSLAVLLAALTLGGAVAPWHLVVLSFLLGIISAVDTPARQSMVVLLIEDPADVPNAIAVNGLMYNLARMVGPSAGGLLVAAYGEGVCFLVNAFTYLFMIFMLFRMSIRADGRRRDSATDGGLLGGFRHARSTPTLRVLLLVLAAIGLVSLPYTVLLPYFAKHVFHGDADTLGLLMGATAFGSVIAALYALRYRQLRRIPSLIAGSCISLGFALAAFSQAPSLPLALAAMMVVGASTLLIGNGSSSLIHTLIPDALRGRTMSLFTVAWFGVVPLGSFAVGALADRIGPEITLVLCGVATLVVGLQFRRNGVPHFQGVIR